MTVTIPNPYGIPLAPLELFRTLEYMGFSRGVDFPDPGYEPSDETGWNGWDWYSMVTKPTYSEISDQGDDAYVTFFPTYYPTEYHTLLVDYMIVNKQPLAGTLTDLSGISISSDVLDMMGDPAGVNGVASLISDSLSLDTMAFQNTSNYMNISAVTSAISTAIGNLINSAPGTLDTLGEIATALASDESVASALATTVAGKANTVHTHVAADITDATTVGKAVLTASSASAARSAIGAGTSSFSGVYTDLTSKPSLATVATSGSYNDLSNKPTIPTANVTSYDGVTAKSGSFPVFKSATVSSGTAVFHLTADGLSAGTALFPNGPITSSLNVFVSDATASYQMAAAWSNSNKTVTVTTNKLTTSNILTGVLGQAAANSATVTLQVWGN